MQFETITDKGTEVRINVRKDHSIYAEFLNPQVGNLKFRVRGWSTFDGQSGIYGTTMIGKKNTRIILTIPEADWLMVKETAESQETADIEKAMALKTVGFKYEWGCDCADTWRIIYEDNDLSWKATGKRHEADKPLVEAIKRLEITEIAKSAGAESLEPHLGSYGGWLFDHLQWHELRKAGETELGKMEATKKEKERKQTEAKAERENARKEFRLEILEMKEGHYDEDDGELSVDPEAKCRLTDSETGKSVILYSRNIFDFGHAVNRVGGGIAWVSRESGNWVWSRYKKPEIPMTDLEIRAVQYLEKFSPIDTEIRM